MEAASPREIVQMDFNKKEEILDWAGPDFIKRIDINQTFLAELVKHKVINGLESQDIAARYPINQRNELLEKLKCCSVCDFLTFCLVLHDRCDQAHIVTQVFGLNVDQLRRQKGATAEDYQEQPHYTPPHTAHSLPQTHSCSLPQSQPPCHPTVSPASSFSSLGSSLSSSSSSEVFSMPPPLPSQQDSSLDQIDNSTVAPHNHPSPERMTRGYLQSLQHHEQNTSMGTRVDPTTSSQPPLKKRKMPSEKTLHHCSFILKEDFKAGDSNLRSTEYTAFVAKIECGLKLTLQEHTKKKLKVSTMCISQHKRMVFVKIECSEGLTEGEIKEALLRAKNQLTDSSLSIRRGTFLFKEEIPAMLTADIIQRRHIEDPLGRRIDFSTQYVRLKILSQKALRAVKRDELEQPDRYQQSLEENIGEDITDEDIITPRDIVKYILIRGRAGIGKSTLVQRLMWRWAHGEWATQFKAIFLLSLRHLMAMKSSMELPDVLSRFAVHRLGQGEITLHAQWLTENESELIFILDGIDEMRNFREKWDKTHTNMSLETEAPALCWAFALMKRMCLPDSTVIVTSRPFSDLTCIDPTMMVEVMGLTRERVMEFVQKNVKPQRVEMVKETLEKQPILLSVSAITFYCAALCQVLETEISVTGKLTTYTQITAFIMERFINHSVKIADENATVQDLSSGLLAMTTLAYSGLMKSTVDGLAQLVFSEEDFGKQNVKQADVDVARQSGMFMQTEVPGSENSGNKQVLGEFVHLSIQEFLAMVGLLKQSPADVKKTLKSMTSSGQFNMALLFLYGFAFNRSSDAIQRLCAAIGVELDVGDEKRTILTQHIKNSRTRLQVLQMIHESQSAEVAQLVGQQRFQHEVKLTKTKMTVVDVLALIFLLKNHHATTSIVLEHVGLDAISMRELCDFLKYNNTVTSLRIVERGLDDESLQYLTDALKVNQILTHLHLDVRLDSDSMKKLSKCLKNNSTMTHVTIHPYNQNKQKIVPLALVLLRHKPVVTLKMMPSKETGLALTTEGGETSLSISSGVITNEDVTSLCSVLTSHQTLTELKISSPNVTAAGVKSVCNVITKNKTLNKLTLSGVYLTDEGAECLLQALGVNSTVTVQVAGARCNIKLKEQLTAHSRITLGPC